MALTSNKEWQEVLDAAKVQGIEIEPTNGGDRLKATRPGYRKAVFLCKRPQEYRTIKNDTAMLRRYLGFERSGR